MSEVSSQGDPVQGAAKSKHDLSSLEQETLWEDVGYTAEHSAEITDQTNDGPLVEKPHLVREAEILPRDFLLSSILFELLDRLIFEVDVT